MDRIDFVNDFGACTWYFKNRSTGKILVESGIDSESALNKILSNNNDSKTDYELLGNLNEVFSKLD